MLKNAFLGKNCKNLPSVGGSAPAPSFAPRGWGRSPPDPCVVTSACYYNVVLYMFCFCFFRTFCTYFFTLNTIVFVEGRKNISCHRAQGTLATPLASNQIWALAKSNSGFGRLKSNSDFGFIFGFGPKVSASMQL